MEIEYTITRALWINLNEPKRAFRFLAHHLNAQQIGPFLILLYQSQIWASVGEKQISSAMSRKRGKCFPPFLLSSRRRSEDDEPLDSDFRLSKELEKTRKNGDCSITEESSRSHRHRRQRRRPYPPTLPFSSGAGSPSWRFRAFRHRSPPRLMLHLH